MSENLETKMEATTEVEETTTAMANATSNLPADYDPNRAYGMEDADAKDIIIPRIKVINALSPERTEGIASEGDILNTLTGENVAGKRFIPVKQFYSNIYWNPDRNAELRMFCRSFDGRIGHCDEGSLSCAACKKNQFDNTKQGKDAQPLCTSYLNFLGFFEGESMPVVLSFARTNYNEGKKLLSIARSMRCPAWNYGYTLESKKVTKDRNTWYILVPKMAGATDAATRALAFELFKAYENDIVNTEYEDTFDGDSTGGVDQQTAAEI